MSEHNENSQKGKAARPVESLEEIRKSEEEM